MEEDKLESRQVSLKWETFRFSSIVSHRNIEEVRAHLAAINFLNKFWRQQISASGLVFDPAYHV